ncbi:MAG TPA: heme exporter protein CcmB [Miltoncostaeaceae bacterium]|nr:heme exporter protein CcmB [Miltoncostaeaceae bacterium]
MSASHVAQLVALLRKDLRLELRTRETAVSMGLFALVAMIIFQFAIGQRADETTPFAAGIMWATIALTAVLGVGRTWVPEREQRVLDALLVAPVSRLTLLVARALALVVYLLAVEAVVVPLAVLFFVRGAEPADAPLIALVCVLADLCIAVVGAFLASMSVFSRARELLLPVLLLPSLVPVVITASGATHAVLGPARDLAEFRGYCVFLAVYALIFSLVAYATFDHVLDD